MVGGPVEEIVEGIENAEGIPQSTISLRTVTVPGTGTDDVANNSVVEDWWIAKELPL
jgi:hypothetical protein